MEVNFFLNVLSIHQAPLIRKLSEVYPVNVFYDEPLSREREELGWYTPNFGSAKVCSIKNINEKMLLKKMSAETVNIFSGLYAYPEVQKLLDKSIKTQALNYVQMESLKLSGIKGNLRKIKYKLISIKYKNKIAGIFSQGGRYQLEKLGFKKVYDFAYFIDKVDSVYEQENSKTNFVYLGALSENKRILELASIFSLKSNCNLDIYGSELDVSIEKLNTVINDSHNIKYRGAISNLEVMSTLKKYDYLILPSKAEGWGAVVAEALLCGVGVIVSDVAGVTNYLNNNFSFGVYIVDFTDIQDIGNMIETLSPLSVSQRKKIQTEAFCLSSDYGAELLIRYVL